MISEVDQEVMERLRQEHQAELDKIVYEEEKRQAATRLEQSAFRVVRYGIRVPFRFNRDVGTDYGQMMKAGEVRIYSLPYPEPFEIRAGFTDRELSLAIGPYGQELICGRNKRDKDTLEKPVLRHLSLEDWMREDDKLGEIVRNYEKKYPFLDAFWNATATAEGWLGHSPSYLRISNPDDAIDEVKEIIYFMRFADEAEKS